MSVVALVLRQARYDNRAFWRNPAAAFFTCVFPLMFLVIFNVIFGDDEFEVAGGRVDPSTFYVPGIVALSVISACYTNIAIGVAFARDRGVLKRLRGTPLPALAFFLGRIIQATFVSILLVIIVTVAGVVLYGVEAPSSEQLPAFVLSLVVGAAAFCALGLAVTALIPNADAAPAVVNATILPLLFISNVFIPTANAPAWLTDFATLFPVVHFTESLHSAFSPFETGSGFEAKRLVVMAIWGVLGVVASLRFFSWEPRK
jgi:ABC-2 type transport system permease protein